jgi:hypothetical protein
VLHRVLFSTDGRIVAALAGKRVCLWERLSGQVVSQATLPSDFFWREAVFTSEDRLVLAGERCKEEELDYRVVRPAVWGLQERRFLWTLGRPGAWYGLALSPDGGTVALGMHDTSVLLYDLPRQPHSQPQRLTVREIQALWSDLGSSDAGRAWRARGALADHRAQAIELIGTSLKPAARKATALPQLPQLLANLDAGEFDKREAAATKLAAALARGEHEVEQALRQLLEKKPSPEVRRRARQLLRPYNEQPLPLPPDVRRAARAIAVLERIGGAEGIALLKKLAAGALDIQTLEARAALDRLGLR